MSMDPTATSGGKLVDRVRDLSQGVAMAAGCRINDDVKWPPQAGQDRQDIKEINQDRTEGSEELGGWW